MATSWADASEIVCGLVLNGKISSNAVREEIFLPPYDEVIKLIKGGTTDIEDIIEQAGLSPVQASLDAVKNLNGLGKSNWVGILENTASSYSAGEQLEKLGKKLKRGDEIDWSIVSGLGKRAQAGLSSTLVPLSQIESMKVPFIKSGWKVIDDHLGGIPEVGLVTLAGLPGTGKTTAIARLASSFAKQYPDKTVIVFSFEMILQEIALRFREIHKLPEAIEKRILLCEKPLSADEVVTIAAAVGNVGMVICDFADYMVKGEVTESSMSAIYRTLSVGSKQLHIPFFLVAQLNRQGGALPRPKDIRYTGMAEALSWMIWMLYDPSRNWNSSEDDKSSDLLPIIDGVAYILVWKVRGGFRVHKDESPGAIAIPFKGKAGWHPTQSKWFSLRKAI